MTSILYHNNIYFEEPFSYCYEKYPYNFIYYIFGRLILNLDIISNISELEYVFDNCDVENVTKLKTLRTALFISNISVDNLAAEWGCSAQAIYNILDKSWSAFSKYRIMVGRGVSPKSPISSDYSDFENRIDYEIKSQLSFALYNNGILPYSLQKTLLNQIAQSKLLKLQHITIEEMDLSVRTFNILKRAGINTINDFLYLEYDNFIKIRNMNPKSFNELHNKLKEYGIELDLNSTHILSHATSLSFFDKSLSELGLTYNECTNLRENGIATVDDLRQKSFLSLNESLDSSIILTIQNVLKKHGYIFDSAGVYLQSTPELVNNAESIQNDDRNNKPIEELDFSVRTFNCLKRVGICTLFDILKLRPAEIVTIRNLGPKSRFEMIKKAESLGFELCECGFVQRRDSEINLEKIFEGLNNNQKCKIYLLITFFQRNGNNEILDCLTTDTTLHLIKELITDPLNFKYDSYSEHPFFSNEYVLSILGDEKFNSILSESNKRDFVEFILKKYYSNEINHQEVSSRLYKLLKIHQYKSVNDAKLNSEEIYKISNSNSELMTQIEFKNILNNSIQNSSGTQTFILSISKALLFIDKNHINSFHSVALVYLDNFKNCSYLTESIKNEIESIMNKCNIKKPSIDYNIDTYMISQKICAPSEYEVEIIRYEKSTYSGGYSGQTVYISVKNKMRKNLTVTVKDIYLIQEDQQIKRDYWLSGYVMTDEKIPPKSLKSAAAIFYDSSIINSDLRYSKIGVELEVGVNKEYAEYIFSYDFSNNIWCKND